MKVQKELYSVTQDITLWHFLKSHLYWCKFGNDNIQKVKIGIRPNLSIDGDKLGDGRAMKFTFLQ